MPDHPSSAKTSPELLQSVLDSTVEGFYSVDTEGHTILCNASFLRMLGYQSADEVIGRKLHGEIHHSHPDGSAYPVGDCPIYKAASQGIGAHVPYEHFFRKDGTAFPVDYRVEPIWQDGRLTGAVCTFTDISERIARESTIEELRRKNEVQFRLMAQAIPHQVWTATPDGRIDWLNSVTYHYSGLGFNELEGEKWVGIVHPDDLSKAADAWAHALKTGTLYETQFRIRRYDGVYRSHIVRAVPISDNGQIARWIGTNTDIEDQVSAAQAVDEARSHLSLMVESAADYAIISISTDALITSWNSGAERIFGYTAEEAIGMTTEMIFTPEDRDNSVPQYELVMAAKNGRASDERWHLRKNGERFYASGIMAAMHDDQKRIKGFVKIARDMTETQRAQEALIAARNAADAANIAKTEFLANMSHEIRTPMNAVIGLSNILAMSRPLTPRQQEFIKTLQMSADSLLALINDLLDIAKIEARTVELEHVSFSVSQVMQEVISMMGVRVREKGLKLTGRGDCVENRLFMGDPTRVRQIILNLCSNAVKFTEQGAIGIEVSCQNSMIPDIETVCIAISDTGIGIADDKLDTIFEKFVQADSSISRKYGGTGLGLAITKTLVEIMSGTLTVESKVGVGSTFKVCLPLERAKTSDVLHTDYSLPALFERPDAAIERPCVLLVEDYEPNVMVASSYLDEFGYRWDVATSGIEAFEKVKTGEYVAVLMDVQMHGMSGLEATALIREHETKNGKPRSYIIGMTAHALSGDRERCLAVGMDDYLPKPFSPADLQTKLETERLLAKSRL